MPWAWLLLLLLLPDYLPLHQRLLLLLPFWLACGSMTVHEGRE
jgi:hypothetical protein